MSDVWDFYFCGLDDDRPASLFVDLGLREEAPVDGLNETTRLRLTLREPRDDGLSSQDEFGRLVEIEDALMEAVAEEAEPIVYVGRVTSHGFRDFHFYSGQAMLAEACLSRTMAAFPDYEFDAGSRVDPEWAVYLGFLYPSPRELRTIQNRRVLAVLEENGDHPEVAREVSHWVDFRDDAGRARFLAEAKKQGFREVSRVESPGDERPFSLCLSAVHAADDATIHNVVMLLYDLAETCDGAYDGWETSVEAGPQEREPGEP